MLSMHVIWCNEIIFAIHHACYCSFILKVLDFYPDTVNSHYNKPTRGKDQGQIIHSEVCYIRRPIFVSYTKLSSLYEYRVLWSWVLRLKHHPFGPQYFWESRPHPPPSFLPNIIPLESPTYQTPPHAVNSVLECSAGD